MKSLRKVLSVSLAVAAMTAAAFAAPAETPGAAEEVRTPDAVLRRTPLENFTLLSEFEISKEDLLEVRRHLTNVRREVGKDFALFPDEKFDVILSREETFREYSNMPEHVKGFFDGRIHLPLPSSTSEMSVKTILWHEYTHAVIYVLSKNKCPGWVHEGFARYEESKIQKPDLRILTDVLAQSPGLPIAPENLDAALAKLTKDPKTALIVYGQAYGFADYLFSRFSRQNIHDFMVELSRGASVEEAVYTVFHLTRKDLDQRWRAHLKKLTGR